MRTVKVNYLNKASYIIVNWSSICYNLFMKEKGVPSELEIHDYTAAFRLNIDPVTKKPLKETARFRETFYVLVDEDTTERTKTEPVIHSLN